MTSAQLIQLREAILVELYLAQRNRVGATVETLWRTIRGVVKCEREDIDSQLEFLKGNGGLVESRDANKLALGLPPIWLITAAGMNHCEATHLV